MKKIGIYSGTFDPVHDGHIAFCLEAIRACKLDQVLLLPEAKPRNKSQVAAFEHRYAMLKMATARLSKVEVVRLKSAQFTIRNTLPELQALLGQEKGLTLLMGSDIAKTMHMWPDLDTLLRSVSLAVGLRSDDDVRGMAATMAHNLNTGTRSLSARVHFITTPYAHVASSLLRSVKLSDNIHSDVADYAKSNQLYTA